MQGQEAQKWNIVGDPRPIVQRQQPQAKNKQMTDVFSQRLRSTSCNRIATRSRIAMTTNCHCDQQKRMQQGGSEQSPCGHGTHNSDRWNAHSRHADLVEACKIWHVRAFENRENQAPLVLSTVRLLYDNPNSDAHSTTYWYNVPVNGLSVGLALGSYCMYVMFAFIYATLLGFVQYSLRLVLRLGVL